MDKMNNYCNNCGNYGHVYRNCRHPILSYGIILYHECGNEGSKIVLVERKDTLSYIEFLRGKYPSITKLDYLELLFSRFSTDELKRLTNNEFDKLWRDLWIDTSTINTRIRKEYNKSKENFNLLRTGYEVNGKTVNLESIIANVDNKYNDNEWEIPKGRRKRGETNRDCAIREFEEETNIKADTYKLINNMIPFIEEYTGINGVRYKHVYYIGKINNECDLKIDKDNKNQYTEVKSIEWCTKGKCLEKIRDYNHSKIKIINDFFDFIDNYKGYISIKDVE
uniref:Nudix hydrolase domain-containing protein n=1 Tax=viral metagenome TaxID=1070528 RepID=A0A6C0F5P4_9ZZZZ|tara:strand:- start:15348 stop:16187 length:840 start_codon:yes stop_codon:yes gene_type:complete